MRESFCERLFQYYPRISDDEDFYSMYISNIAINSFLSYTAIMLNIVTIHAIRKTSSLPKTLKTLLLSLAVSDVGVGLLGQPFYISILIKRLQQITPNCITYKIFYVIGNLFCTASFFGVLAVSVDRFLAIHLHLRYQELVTHKRVVAVVISIWVLSLFIPFLMFSVSRDAYSLINGISGVIGFILITMVYIRIYLAVRRHRNQILVLQARQIAQTGGVANFASLIKSAADIFYVCLLFLLCYIPYLVSVVATEMNGPSIVLKRFSLFSFTLAYLNSSLNPVIYCWKMRHIRNAVIDILRNMSWLRNHALHETLASLAGHTKPWFSVIIAVKCLMHITANADSSRYRKTRKIAFILSNANTSKYWIKLCFKGNLYGLWAAFNGTFQIKTANGVIFLSVSKNQNEQQIR